MNLIIDIGNTKVKLAVFEEDKLVLKTICTQETVKKNMNDLLNKFDINRSIISSVGKINESNIFHELKDIETVVLNAETKVPFTNKYKTPITLGVDRIALVCACVKNYPKQNCLVIDAGTCITYDFINQNSEYLGGAISPGVNMRYKSLNTFTANLPLLKLKGKKKLIGNTSKSAIHSGVINGTVFEIEGVVKKYRKKYRDLTVILTGGDAKFLSKQLKNGIFANSNFLLEGLNFILEFNSCE